MATSDSWPVVGDLSRLDPGPLVPLDPDAQREEDRRDDHDLHAHPLSVVHLGLGGPVEELGYVLGHLRRRRGCLVLVVDQAVVEHTGHGDTGTGEVGVEVKTLANLRTRRGFLGVAGQQREDVVAAAVTGLDDQAQIRGQSTVVGKPSGLVVLVRIRDVVRQLSGSLLDLALVVGLGIVLVLLGQRLGLIDGQDRTDESSVRDSAERVACRADLSVDLETTAKSICACYELGVSFLLGRNVRTYAWASKVLSHCWWTQGY